MTLTNKILLGLLMIAITVIFIQDSCNEPPEPEVIVKYLPQDTIEIEIEKEVPVPGPTVYVKGDPIEVPADVDSNAVYAALVDSNAIMQWYLAHHDYNVVRPYNKWILDDTNGRIYQIDTVYRNKIVSRSYPVFEIYTHTYEVIKPPPLKNLFFIGGGVGGSTQHFEFWVDGMVINKKKRAYSASYGILGSQVKVSILFNL